MSSTTGTNGQIDGFDDHILHTSNPRPIITVGSAPHLGGYTPRDRQGLAWRQAHVGGEVGAGQANLNAINGVMVAERNGSDSDIESETSSFKGSSSSPPTPTGPVAPERGAIDELPTSSELMVPATSGAQTAVEHWLGDETAPKAVMVVLHPDAAQIVEASVNASGTGYAKVWNIDQERSLVAYSSLLEDWNAIVEVAEIRAPRRPWRSFWGRWRARLALRTTSGGSTK